jgi:hypothetical protein
MWLLKRSAHLVTTKDLWHVASNPSKNINKWSVRDPSSAGVIHLMKETANLEFHLLTVHTSSAQPNSSKCHGQILQVSYSNGGMLQAVQVS